MSPHGIITELDKLKKTREKMAVKLEKRFSQPLSKENYVAGSNTSLNMQS